MKVVKKVGLYSKRFIGLYTRSLIRAMICDQLRLIRAVSKSPNRYCGEIFFVSKKGDKKRVITHL